DSSSVESAYGLYINGELCAAAKSYGDIRFIMETFLDQYKTGTPGEQVTFMGTTDIISGLYSTDRIVSSEKFATTISTKRTETQFYTVNEGDTAQSIANVANMSYDRLMKLNENLSDTPEPGTSVLLEKELPVLKVQTIRTVTVKEKIKFDKKTVKNDNEYTSYSKCITKGVNGEREVIKLVTEINGVQVSSEVISSTVTKEPVDAVYEVGTKKGSKVGSGSFLWPVPGVRTISSPYGYRWGRLHKGIDISTGGIYGRTVVAADSGTATVKRSATGYGLHIIISHGNGYSTCYAHLSAVNISSGQVVAKGQAIGRVGNSGSSTGPHLHFEIRKNNVAGNPMNYY
ncbi:MAG: M23 family metallopeptidase, partial [Acutalibacteraceae bacterium]|nr:M23 family metallopeptidase [Acutalibacteraceae bacterium]